MLGQVPYTPPSEGFFHDLTLLLPNFILALHTVSGLFLKYIFFSSQELLSNLSLVGFKYFREPENKFRN